jgi:hypothetical protein
MPNARHRRIAVMLGVVAEQFVGHQATIGPLAHDVGEGASSIDPKLPLTVFYRWFHGVVIYTPRGRDEKWLGWTSA